MIQQQNTQLTNNALLEMSLLRHSVSVRQHTFVPD
jgi:hypothetical protein